MEYVYAALVLHKLGKPVDEEGLKKVIEAAGGTCRQSTRPAGPVLRPVGRHDRGSARSAGRYNCDLCAAS